MSKGFKGAGGMFWAALVWACLSSHAVAWEVETETRGATGEAGETGRPNHRTLNLRLGGAGAFALGEDLERESLGESGGQATVGMDLVLMEPAAASLVVGYNGFVPGDAGSMHEVFFALGFKFRFAVDRSGALNEIGGNVLGDLWMDLHFGFHRYQAQNHGGLSLGLGYEFALTRGLNVGPFGRVQLTPWGFGLGYLMFAVGIQASVGVTTDLDGQRDRGAKSRAGR